MIQPTHGFEFFPGMPKSGFNWYDYMKNNGLRPVPFSFFTEVSKTNNCISI